jgi:ribosomal protein L11 methyltransferase
LPYVTTNSLLEISLSDLDEETAQCVTDLFNQWGRGGAVVEHIVDEVARSRVKTYLLSEDDQPLRQIEIGLELLNRALGDHPDKDSAPVGRLLAPQIRFLAESDWAEAWKANYDVLEVGRHLVIKPSWCDYFPQPGDLIISLDPGMAFGSGLHPTTRLCLEILEDYVRPHAAVLDVGTGSGILAIAAVRLGASTVVALDTDPLAARIARENVYLNNVEAAVHVEQGSVQVLDVPPATFNIVIANILSEAIIELASALAASLSSDSVLVASGIIADQSAAVIDALREAGVSILERRDADDWVALIARKALH